MLIIIRSTRDYEPLKFFGLPGGTMFVIGVLSSIVLFLRWLMYGIVDPYLIIVYANVFLIIVGILMIILGMLADMLERNRLLMEEVLYRQKR